MFYGGLHLSTKILGPIRFYQFLSNSIKKIAIPHHSFVTCIPTMLSFFCLLMLLSLSIQWCLLCQWQSHLSWSQETHFFSKTMKHAGRTITGRIQTKNTATTSKLVHCGNNFFSCYYEETKEENTKVFHNIIFELWPYWYKQRSWSPNYIQWKINHSTLN